jgi:hypothetical protein
MLYIKVNISYRNIEERNPCTSMGFAGNDKNFVNWKVIGGRKSLSQTGIGIRTQLYKARDGYDYNNYDNFHSCSL